MQNAAGPGMMRLEKRNHFGLVATAAITGSDDGRNHEPEMAGDGIGLGGGGHMAFIASDLVLRMASTFPGENQVGVQLRMALQTLLRFLGNLRCGGKVPGGPEWARAEQDAQCQKR